MTASCAPPAANYFGCSLAVVGGDRLPIGAQGDRSQAIADGAAFHYDSKGGRLTTFFSPQPEASERFGCSVAALGPDRVVIGAKGHTSGGWRAGAAYLFRTDGTWRGAYANPSPEADDFFGSALTVLDQPYLGRGVWFKFTPVTDGWIAVETCGSDFPTVLPAFQGICDTRASIPCGDYRLCDDGRAALLFGGTAGTSYRILPGGRDGASGNLRIVVRPTVVRTLTVSSYDAWPQNRVPISLAPKDLEGRPDGTTIFTRRYEDASGSLPTLHRVS